jgi:CTP synthase
VPGPGSAIGQQLAVQVQVIPHVTDEIKRAFAAVSDDNDIVIVEIGGTVGDYENVLFLEAVRQMKHEGEKVIYIHVTYVPVLKSLGEAKTNQHNTP